MKKKIILVDDDNHCNKIHKKLIETNFSDIDVVEIENGKDFISYVFSEGKYADTGFSEHDEHILLDILMPEMGGIEAMEHIKSRDYNLFKKLKISVLSSVVSIELNNKIKNLSIVNYVQKPLRMNTLNRILGNLSQVA